MGQFDFNFTEEEKIGQDDKMEKSKNVKKMFIILLKFMVMTAATIVLLYVIKVNFYKTKSSKLSFQDVLNNKYNS